jgi:hypothetical protein
MKSWIILIVLAVVLTAAATFALPFLSSESSSAPSFPVPLKPDGPAPVVEVAEALIYDFGILPQQITGHHTWTFKNVGPGPLELRGVTSTCSCTTADLLTDKKEGKEVILKPGESRPIVVSFETKTWEKFHQSVTVATNDPSRQTVILTITGTPKPAITTFPPSTGPTGTDISFGVASNELETVRKVDLYSGDRPDFKILNATSTNPALIGVGSRPLTPEEAKVYKTEKGYSLDITLKPTSNLGAFAEEVLVETDHPHKSKLTIKVVGRVTGPITFVPERVIIRGATSSNGGTERLKIVARGRSSVNFTVTHKPKALDLSIEPIAQPEGAKGSLYWMIAKVIPGTESGRIVDEIILKTDDPSASEVKVPVDVIVQGAR